MRILFKLLGLFAILLFLFWPQNVSAKSYYYKNVQVKVFINPDSTFDVEEWQTFSFNGPFTYAYRDIELKRLESISDISVWDASTNSSLPSNQVEITKSFNSANIKWYYNLTNAEHTWIVKYKVHGGLGNFKNYDELYWNAIWGERDATVQTAEVLVYFPKAIEKDNFMQKMFIGGSGSTNQSQNFQVVDEETLRYEADNIMPGEIVTIVAGFPKGIVSENPFSAKVFLYKLLLYAGIFLPLAIILAMVYLWWKNGRDKGTARSIAPEFSPPSKLTPAEVGVLSDEKADQRDLTATIIDLAVKGYLRITKIEKRSIFQKENYRFDLLKDYNKGISENESFVLNSLFSFTHSKTVTTEQLKDNFYVYIDDINKRFYGRVYDLGFFEKNPQKVRLKYIIYGIVISCLGTFFFGLVSLLLSALVMAFGLILTGIFVIILGYFMPAKTEKGRRELEKWLGFKMFLEKTEKFKLKDSVNQKTFESFLPYAIVFGVEKQWANRFFDLKFSQPSWYVSPVYVANFSGFTSSLSSSMSSVSASIATSPSSSSGFGGGGGGGGGGAG